MNKWTTNNLGPWAPGLPFPTGGAITLKDTPWAMQVLGYAHKSRSAFWQFVHANGVPFIRTGKRKIQFLEAAVYEWLKGRSSNS